MDMQIQNDLGTITIPFDVLQSVAGYAVREHFHAYAVAAEDSPMELNKDDKRYGGAKISELEQESVSLDLAVSILRDTNVLTLAPGLRAALRSRLLQAAGLHVKDINLYVAKIHVK